VEWLSFISQTNEFSTQYLRCYGVISPRSAPSSFCLFKNLIDTVCSSE